MTNDARKSEAEAGGDVTRVLERAQKGDPNAAAELLPLVYDELRRLAAAKMAHERPDQTLQPTALVHEAWLRLFGNRNQEWHGRAHFFGAAAEAMRRILVDRARERQALKRGGTSLAPRGRGAPVETTESMNCRPATIAASAMISESQALSSTPHL